MNDLFGLAKILPLEKLIEVVAAAVGRISKSYFDRVDVRTKAYERVTMAETHFKEVAIISQAIKEGNLQTLSLPNTNQTMAIDSPNSVKNENETMKLSTDSLEVRATIREGHWKNIEQANLESITSLAAQILKNEKEVTDTALDEDWQTRFFKTATEISNEEMQRLWGRILAGEIQKPGSYSIRTLEVLRNMNQEEAECFTRFARLAVKHKNTTFVLNFTGEELMQEKYGLNFLDRLLLEEIGLLSANNLKFGIPETHKDGAQLGLIVGNYYISALKEPHLPEKNVSALAFTKVGQELIHLIQMQPDFDYIQLVASKLAGDGVKTQYAKIIKIEEKKIRHEKLEDIPPYIKESPTNNQVQK